MPESWQSAWVEVLPDFKNFRSKANSEMSGVLGSAGTAGGLVAGNNMKPGILGGIKGLAGPILGAIAALGIGRLVGEAIGSGISYALDSVDLASDLEQSTGAVLAVFKDQATIIEGFGKNAAKDVGLARTEYQKFAVVVGAQLKNLGIPMGRVSGQTNDLIELGADLAAQFGGPTSDAVNALSSLLRGERDPIERYGVGIKQADINARLAAQGLNGLTGEALKQAEIQATLAILWAQTADAQGTFAAESDTLAGQQQRLQATLADTQTKLGEKLLPAFTDMAMFANETLVPALGGFIDKIGPILGEALDTASPKIQELLDKIVPLAEAFVTSAAEDGIPALIAGLDEFTEHAPEWIETFNTADQAVRDFDQAFKDMQADLQNSRLDRIAWFDDVLTQFGNFFVTIDGEMDNWNADMKTAGADLIQQFINGITSMTKGVTNAVDTVLRAVKDFFPHSPAKRGPFSGAGWTQVAKSGADLMSQFTSGMQAPDISGAMRSMVSVPSISAHVASSVAGSGGGRASEQPIYMDGSLFGVLRTLANGEARIVLNDSINRAYVSGR